MFGPRYFGARYFGPRYWGAGGTSSVGVLEAIQTWWAGQSALQTATAGGFWLHRAGSTTPQPYAVLNEVSTVEARVFGSTAPALTTTTLQVALYATTAAAVESLRSTWTAALDAATLAVTDGDLIAWLRTASFLVGPEDDPDEDGLDCWQAVLEYQAVVSD